MQGLYGMCDDGVGAPMPPHAQALALLQGGVRILQIRLKHASTREALATLSGIVDAARPFGAKVIVNDRVDWALLAGAQGVHVGDDDVPPDAARKVLGPHAIVGVTVRDVNGAEQAQRAGASYVGVGPVFATQTKRVEAPVLGIEGLSRIVADSPLPVVAIGGIRLATIAEVAQTGAQAAAVVSDALLAPDVATRARELSAQFERGVRARAERKRP